MGEIKLFMVKFDDGTQFVEKAVLPDEKEILAEGNYICLKECEKYIGSTIKLFWKKDTWYESTDKDVYLLEAVIIDDVESKKFGKDIYSVLMKDIDKNDVEVENFV